MQPWFTCITSFFDIGRPCYGQLTPVKRRHLVTSITWPYCQLKFRAYEGQVFLKLTADQVLVFNWIMGSCQVNFSCCKQLGRVVWKPVNANPGLKINGSINLPCIRMFFTAFVLCILRLFKLKTECQTILRQKTSQQSYKTHSTYPGLA